MKEKNYKMKIFDIFEVIFDIGYLIFDLIGGILFFIFSKGEKLFILYGILTLILCFGDAFHLIPRVKKSLFGIDEKTKKQMGFGLQVSSITMTIFYILLLYIWKETFKNLKAPTIIEILIWLSALIRIFICLLPQNNWTSGNENKTLSIIRNSVFLICGLGIIILYTISGNIYGLRMYRMVWAIIISFACYLPVTLFSKKYPKIGMLMIPKTCSYIWIIVMGLQILFY